MSLKELITDHWAWDAGQYLGTQLATGEADRGQVNTLITVVTIGIVAIIGVLVFDEVETSITFNSGSLSNSSSNVTDGFGDAMDLIPVVLLVLVASLVIAVVQQF
jgi:hypothetical protein